MKNLRVGSVLIFFWQVPQHEKKNKTKKNQKTTLQVPPQRTTFEKTTKAVGLITAQAGPSWFEGVPRAR